MLMQIVTIKYECVLGRSQQETDVFVSKQHRMYCPILLQLATTTAKGVVDYIFRNVKTRTLV